MSYNRTSYDVCAYQAELTQSVAPLQYTLDPIKYEHCNKCRHEFGLIGGPSASHVTGNLVDLENELRNANKPYTLCPSYKYLPSENNIVSGKEYIKPVEHPKIDTNLKHLPSCQMFGYPHVPLPEPIAQFKCSKS